MSLCIDVTRIFAVVLHLVAFGQNAFGIYYDLSYVVIPQNNNDMKIARPGFGGRSRFLTYWCLITQAFYFTLCVANDLVGTNEIAPRKSSNLRKFRDYVFATFAFPLAMNVGISFWTLMAIDRELILPKSFDVFFPSWLNHVLHTNVMIFIVMELFTTFRLYPSRKTGFTGILLFNIAYVVWINIIKLKSGTWVYPILDVLTMPQRIGFIIFIGLFGLSFYFVGEYVNNKIWASELKQLKTGGKKHK